MNKHYKLLEKYMELRKRQKLAKKIALEFISIKRSFEYVNVQDTIDNFKFFFISSFFLNIFVFVVAWLQKTILYRNEELPTFLTFFNTWTFFCSIILLTLIFNIISNYKIKKNKKLRFNNGCYEIIELKKKLNKMDASYKISDDINYYLSTIQSDINKIKDEFKNNDFKYLKELAPNKENEFLYIKELRDSLKYKNEHDEFSIYQKKLKIENEKIKQQKKDEQELKNIFKEYQKKKLTESDILRLQKITNKLANKISIENI